MHIIDLESGNQELLNFLTYIQYIVILTRKEKESLVIHFASQGRTTRENAKAAHISPEKLEL
jgi:DNA-binding CsgD family transcriptional regulator